MNRQFGMPMGPMRLADLVGGDISLHVGANFVENFADRVYTSQLIPMLNEAKRLGEKTGAAALTPLDRAQRTYPHTHIHSTGTTHTNRPTYMHRTDLSTCGQCCLCTRPDSRLQIPTGNGGVATTAVFPG